MIIIIINYTFFKCGTNNGQTKIKDSWNQLKYKAGEVTQKHKESEN